MAKTPKAKVGFAVPKAAPATTYSPELTARLCEALAGGMSLTKWCKPANRPSKAAVFKWLATYPEFRAAYDLARQDQAHSLADEVIDIADSATDAESAQVAKVRMSARQWYASKLAPKDYGDKVDVGGNVGLTVEIVRFCDDD